MVTQKKRSSEGRLKIIKTKLFIFKCQLLIVYLFSILPATATEAVLSVVQSQENTTQWTGITNRLQTVGIKYCVIPLASVKNVRDLGDRKVLLLPNVETLTPTQALALEEWMSKGGRLIATGPVGSLSAPGVRSLMRSLLGGYWGFSLNGSQKLQPSKTKLPQWANQNGLFGEVRGGVVIPDNLTAQAAAVWDSKDNPVAVVATERSMFFGWRWGVDAAAGADVDTAWLQAALNRYVKMPVSTSTNKVEAGATRCPISVATAPINGRQGGQGRDRGVISSSSSPSSSSSSSSRLGVKTAFAPQLGPIPNITPQKSEEAIDKLEQRVRLDFVPNSQARINPTEAIALVQELENLIGRVESANLAASANGNNSQIAKLELVQVASTTGIATSSKQEVLRAARQVAKNLSKLIAQKNYAQARQQWLMAKKSLLNQFPFEQRLAQPEIRAMWLDRGTIVRARNEQGLAEIFDRMAQAGINTVFFETVNASYPIYPSQIAPQQNPLTRGWDPLAAAVKLAHERGMELHAWVWTFAAGNTRHNQVINIDPNYLGPLLATYPDWAGYDNRGQIIPVGQTKPFLDPANPQVRQYLLSLYEEIVTRYNVDGLQLDYIRYPFQDPNQGRTYGYGKAARAQFQQLWGVDPINISPSQQDLWQKWTEFRTGQIDSFVASLSQQLRQKRPNLILSVAVFPLPELERIQKIQQHWEIWARRGDVDLIVPMTYAHDTPRFDRLAQPWIASRQLGSSLLVPGIRLTELPTVGAFDQIQLIRDLPVSGYALFATDSFSNDLYKVFNRTQGSTQAQKQPIPLRMPFQTAAARYTALQQEWKFVSQNNQLRVPTAMLSDFNTQAELLQTALNLLAKEPSATKLQGAKASLLRFQSLFRTWMRLQATENPYQVKVWENRLSVIERLLRYGERREVF